MNAAIQSFPAPLFSAGYRASGMVLHVTYLPSAFGIGDVGPVAYSWVNHLADAGQNWCQALPLGPTGYGNRPSNTILVQRLIPQTPSTLVALYEHRVFAQGVIWNIDSFNQWGVELGKVLAQRIISELAIDEAVPAPVLSAALYGRFASRGEAMYQDKLLSAMRVRFGGHLEKPSVGQ